MSGVQRLFFNKDNVFLNGVVTATTTKPSSSYFVSDWDKTGHGLVTPSGSYTGTSESEFDIKIVAGASINRYPTFPKFETSGNGSIENITIADSTDTQTIKIVLAEKATINTKSHFPITEDVKLESVLTGANTITLLIDTNSLVLTETIFYLLHNISAGQDDFVGNEWDWETKQITDTGEIPTDALRFVFSGDDEKIVYRQYKELKEGVWHYRICPTPTKNYKKGQVVLSVTGDYDCTLTQTSPSVIENFSIGKTLYDMLIAIQTNSNIVSVIGNVSKDRTPYTGLDALDVNLRTEGYALSIEVEGRELEKTSVIDIDVKSGAPNQTLQLECINNAKFGNEVWSIQGDISGRLPNAISNITYNSSIIDFKIIGNSPATIRNDIDMGNINILYKPIEREASESTGKANAAATEETTVEYPELEGGLCVQKPIIGSKAINGLTIFTYTKKTAASCKNCNDVIYDGKLNYDFLGLEGGVDEVTTIDPNYKSRLTNIANARYDLVNANTAKIGGTSAVDNWFVYYVEKLSLLPDDIDRWRLIYVEYDIADPPPYDITTIKGVRSDKLYLNTTDFNINGLIGMGIIKRKIFTAEIDATNFIAQLESEGTAILYSKPDEFTEIDERFNEFERDEAFRTGVIPYDLNQFLLGSWYIPPYSYTDGSGNIVKRAGHWDTPTNIFLKAPTADDKFHFVAQAQAAREMSLIGDLDEITIADKFISIAEDILVQVYDNPTALAEWDLMWTEIDTDIISYMEYSYIELVKEEYYEKYRAWGDKILLLADIIPAKKSNSSNFISGEVWADDPSSDFHWVSDRGHLPAFTNRYYHSAKINRNGDVYSTKEFGFALTTACPESLKEGDQVYVQIDGTRNNLYTYQVGDIINIPIASETPLILEGGLVGNYINRWNVFASVDGKLADYSNSSISGSETPYSDSGIGFTILNGDIPYNLGDTISFDIEDNQFQYRRDGGAWSANKDIDTDNPVLLESGVSVLFNHGLTPSYVIGDEFTFSALQPYSFDNAKYANKKQWVVDTPTAQITVVNNSPVNAIMIDNHSLIQATVIQVEGLTALGTQVWQYFTDIAEWNENTITSLFPTQTGHNKIRVSFSDMGLGESAIGWLWVGLATETKGSAEILKRRNYSFETGGDILNPNKEFKGKGTSLDITWQNLSLTKAEFDDILEGIDYAFENNEPIGILPHYLHTGETVVGNLDFNSIEQVDVFNFQTNVIDARIMTLSFSLSAIYK